MPGWRETVEPFVKAGKLVAIGVVQEQHPDRARLYRQWRRLDWPIYIDALNTFGISGVPIPLGIDESGLVRLEGAITKESVQEFVERSFPRVDVPAGYNRAEKPDLKAIKTPRDRGDYHFFHDGAPEALDRAIEAYEQAVKADAKDARAEWRLGVAYRARYDSARRRPDDVQRAVEHWENALSLQPNMYIWRRRIQQFGPRLDKPYDFYFWVEEARKEILARGEKPVELVAEPTGSEVAPPAKGPAAPAAAVPDPDPQGRLARDKAKLVGLEPVVTPARVRPGGSIRVRLTFRLDEKTRPWWNNEGDGLAWSVKLPEGVTLVEGTFVYPKPKEAETQELRVMEFEAAVADGLKGKIEIPGYAVYGVCEHKAGVCRYLRQDLRIAFVADPEAPRLQ